MIEGGPAGPDSQRRGFWGSLFLFTGRSTRQTYWLTILLLLGTYLGWVGLLELTNESSVVGIAGLVVAPAWIWINIANNVKRWHDRGKSGWMVLVGLIPILGAIWILVECGFFAGTFGPNEYGPDPLVP